MKVLRRFAHEYPAPRRKDRIDNTENKGRDQKLKE